MNSPQQNAAKAASGELGGAVPGGNTKLEAQNPWPGLEAYNEASSDYFHGRNSEADELLRLIRLAPLTVIYGKSGLGKTSLLQAGLFPLLRDEHYLPVLLRLDFAGATRDLPLEQVKRRLKGSLDSVKADYPAWGGDESLWEYLHRKDAEFWSTDNFPLTPVLVFDQFEELFSRSRGNVEQVELVLNGLADLIENRIPAELAQETAGAKRSRLDLLSQRYRIVLSFREDFLPEIRTWERRVPSLLRSSMRLEPMSRECAIETVVRSGKTVLEDGEAASSALDTLKEETEESARANAKKVLEDSVAASIVDLVGKGERKNDPVDAADMVEPVLLSLCCTQLNERRRGGARIDKKLVEAAGQNILQNFYRDALEDPEVKGEPDARSFIEDYLIQGDFRGDYPEQGALEGNKIRKEQLDALTNRRRLLRIVPRGNVARIELIHDRLVPVVRASRDIRKAKEEERQKRSRIVTIVFAALTVVLLATTIVAVWALRQATTQQQLATGQRKVAEQQEGLAKTEAARAQRESEIAKQETEKAREAARISFSLANKLDNKQVQAAVDASAATLPRVYMQIVNESDRDYAKQVAARLTTAGVLVLGIQYVPTAAGLKNSDVRYYRQADKTEAETILHIVQEAGAKSAVLNYLTGHENDPKIRPNHFEVWLASGSGSNSRNLQ